MSQAILDEVKKLESSMQTAIQTATEAQESATKALEIGGDVEKMDATLKTIVETSAKAANDAQDAKQNIDKLEKTLEFIEKSVSRMGSTDSVENKELEERASEEMACYLRTKKPMSPEVVEMVVNGMAEKAFFGLGEEKRNVEIKTLIAGNNPDSGYFIRPQRSATMIKRFFETSNMRGIANIETTSSDSMEYIIDDDQAASGGWVGETSSRGQTDTPQIGLLTIPAHEQFAQPKATQKSLDDAGFDIESWLSSKTTDIMIRTENTAFVVGDGSQKPRGFLDYPAWTSGGVYERFKLEQVNSGSAGAFTADGVKDLQNSLLEIYQGSATFVTKRASWQSIITLKDGSGAYLLDPRSLKLGDTMILLGKPVLFFDDMPAIASNSLSLVYGDFSLGYTILDRIGFRVIRDVFTEKPNILFYTTKRTGGAVTNYESLKIQKLAT